MQSAVPLACFLSMIRPPGVQFENALLQIAPVDKAKCPFVKDGNDIGFRLYTRHNPTVYEDLVIDDDEKLFASSIDFHAPTVIHFHAFMETPDDGSGIAIREAYALRGDTNIIMVDASRLEAGPWYFTAAENTWYIGNFAAQFIDFLVARGLDLSKTHLIGHSLGAQAAGVAGTALKSGRVSRITGLDPALPLFAHLPPEQRLDKGDADFVDVIHTDAGIFGVNQPVGHVDFYPNGGISPQPGCELEVVLPQAMLLNKCDENPLSFYTFHLTPNAKPTQTLAGKLQKLFTFIRYQQNLGKQIKPVQLTKETKDFVYATLDDDDEGSEPVTKEGRDDEMRKEIKDGTPTAHINEDDLEMIDSETTYSKIPMGIRTTQTDNENIKGFDGKDLSKQLTIEDHKIDDKPKDFGPESSKVTVEDQVMTGSEAKCNGNYNPVRKNEDQHSSDDEFSDKVNITVENINDKLEDQIMIESESEYKLAKPVLPDISRTKRTNEDAQETDSVGFFDTVFQFIDYLLGNKVIANTSNAKGAKVAKDMNLKDDKIKGYDDISNNTTLKLQQTTEPFENNTQENTNVKLNETDTSENAHDKDNKDEKYLNSQQNSTESIKNTHTEDSQETDQNPSPATPKRRKRRFISFFKRSEAEESENFLFKMLNFLLKNRKDIPVYSVFREINTLVKSAHGELNHVTKERNNFIGAPPPLSPVSYSLELGNESRTVAFVKRLLGLSPNGDRLTINGNGK